MVLPPTLTGLLVVCTGLGMMPPETLLAGIPQISSSPAEARTTMATTLTGGGDVPVSSGTLTRDSVATMMANLLLQATPGHGRPGQRVTRGA